MKYKNIKENPITYFISELAIYASWPVCTRRYAYTHTLAKMPLPNATQSMQQEGRIALAMDALKQGHFTSARGAAKAYDVVYSTLQNRINGHPARRDSEPRN